MQAPDLNPRFARIMNTPKMIAKSPQEYDAIFAVMHRTENWFDLPASHATELVAAEQDAVPHQMLS